MSLHDTRKKRETIDVPAGYSSHFLKIIMRPTFVSLLIIAFALFSSAEIVERDSATTTAAYNYGSISAVLESFASAVSTAAPASVLSNVPAQTANLSNIAAPPSDFIPVIMTAVPMSVLGDILDSASRSSLASEFQNGTTPAWYQSLPSSIQSYLTVVRSQINEGALSSNVSATVATTSSSTAKAAPAVPAPTGAMAVNMLGALGIAGLALAL
ncbi:hypothetical protein UA08_01700 [Talaromyces atroroseus]|uniref:Uncharacterized protein n=1 Tax=Talaromyces atroroseus TaxID=1441469 RepID=A0A1Q5QAA1_TALAT|nr:hypothetical protein UA08_01700 [Talaromyces atroroseus]OKL62821.1 hypothetical protein UA08_01700 [Talaromyces atroroseus]